MASTPCLSANSRSSASFSVSDGVRTRTPGRLMPLCSPSMPPLTISQATSSPFDLVDAQLDQSVGEQDARALFDVFSQGLEGGAHQRRRARHLARRDGEPVAGLEQHGLMILEQAGANLGPLQVAQDAQRLALFLAHLADLLDDGGLALVAAVGKIEPDDVHAGADQVANDGLGVGGGPERGDNFGAALRRGIRQVQIVKGHQKYLRRQFKCSPKSF